MTVREIEAAKPGTILWDTQIRGLALRAFVSRKSFYLKYRTTTGLQRYPKLGDYPRLSLPMARATAHKLLAEVAQGGDPGNRSAQRTVADLFRHYQEVHAPKQAARTRYDYETIWRRNIEPKIGRLKLADVNEQRCAELYHSLRHAPVQANRTMAILRSWFNLAEDWGWRPRHSNPVHVKPTREEPRQRYPGPGESDRLVKALDETDDIYFVSYVWLLVLTGARPGEILRARWEWVTDLGLALPEAKHRKKGRLITLSSAAREVLKSIPRQYKNPHIFPSLRRGGKHRMGFVNEWRALLVEAGIKNLQLRDLRRYFASLALSGGVPLDQVGQLLGHTQSQTTRRYAYLITEARQEAAENVAIKIRRAKPS